MVNAQNFKLLVLIPIFFGAISFGKAQEHNVQFIDFPVAQGNTTLTNPTAGGINSGQFSEIDLDIDGELDLVVFDRTSNKLSTYLWRNGSYEYEPQYEYLFPNGLINWVLLRDYDGDGYHDLFTSTNLGVRVFHNDAAQTDSLSWSLVADPIVTQGNSLINLFVNTSDLPSIGDIDEDGDLDILVFNFATGGLIEYHENRSFDEYGHRDSLKYVRVTREWGDFQECFCGQFAFGNEMCDGTNRLLHISGKALTVSDTNSDGLADVLFGEEECGNLFNLPNVGDLENALFRMAEIPLPELSDVVFFPAAYLIDISHNGIQELIVSPNARSNELDLHDYSSSVFAYEKTNGAFINQKKGFLQSSMIDVGERSYPALGDVDNDGDMDLLIGNRGSILSEQNPARLSYYENIGSPSDPNFVLQTDDFLELSSLRLSYLKPKIKDLDGDRLPELIFTGNSAEGHILSIIKGSSMGLQASERSEYEVPFNELDQYDLHDVNRDGSIDLLVGTSGGRLDLYLNNGPSLTPNFELEEQGYLGMTVNPFRTNLSIAVVQNGSRDDLITYDDSGELRIISDFRSNQEPVPFLLKDINVPTRLGRIGSLSTASLIGDNSTNIILGSVQGGIYSLSYSSDSSPVNPGDEWSINVYPNPTLNGTNVTSNRASTGRLITLSGQTLLDQIVIRENEVNRLELSNLSQGLYILQLADERGANQYVKVIVYD